MTTRDSSMPIGVGIDTARYGHHVTFLYEDRQPAAEPITVMENAEGYQLLRVPQLFAAENVGIVYVYREQFGGEGARTADG